MIEIGSSTDIAVVGMACRFPGAPNADQFWRNIRDGIESVQQFNESELLDAGVDSATIADPNYVRAGIVLEDMEMWDAGFFGFSPKDAAIMDPQHRHFLECSWEALENAAHLPETFNGPIGVFAGCGMNAYLMYNLMTNRRLMDSVGMFLIRHTGNDKDFLATRVSYQFNLKGPSISVQTACSTSLVAIHLASQSLLSGECDMALAGGVTIELPHRQGYMYREGEILSKDGHCRSFDAESTGTIFGSGAGVVVLRRLADAVRDGDTIYSVVKGSAINNDGASKIGYLAPSVDGQAHAIREALAVAGVEAETVSYVETHGTATAVGDPIEITALTEAFRASTDRRAFCGIGSVKTNIGHLDTAAGVASFIKASQALRHKQMPPSLHFRKPNPLLDLASGPFFVNSQLRDWSSNGHPRRAGVSSLGVGGTNAHLILEEAPALEQSSVPSLPWQLIPISARSKEALDAATERLGLHLEGIKDARSFADACYTAQIGRRSFDHRRIVVASSGKDASDALTTKDPRRVGTQLAADTQPSIVFVFPGGGSQYPQMGRELYDRLPIFRRHVDECLGKVEGELGYDLKAFIYPASQEDENAARNELAKPLNSILSIFIIEYALGRQWLSWGVTPSAMTGHSLGEYTAACLSGAITLDDALGLVILRGRLFEGLPDGAMLNVALSENQLREIMSDRLSIAAINGPKSCVVSGEVALIVEFETSLSIREVECSRLHISVAAHSPMLEPFLPEFSAHAARIRMGTPSIPYVSNLTGAVIQPADLDSTYWVRHLRQTVRFADGLQVLLAEPNRIFIEVGPGTTLTSLVKQHADWTNTHEPVASLPHPKDRTSSLQYLLGAVGRLWLKGYPIDWSKLSSGEVRRRVALPTYPFEHQRHWIEPGKPLFEGVDSGDSSEEKPDRAVLKKRTHIESWFYEPSWQKARLPDAVRAEAQNWLIFCDSTGLGDAVARHLRSSGCHVVCVRQGESFSASSEEDYTLPVSDPSQVRSLITSLLENGRAPRHALYLWSYEFGHLQGDLDSRIGPALETNFHIPMKFIQVMAEEDQLDAFGFSSVVAGLKKVADTDQIRSPECALITGPAKVLAAEYPGVRSRVIDVEFAASPNEIDRLAGIVVEEALSHGSNVDTVAYRKGTRYVEKWRRATLSAPSYSAVPLNSTFVITGGTGGMALSFAEHLAREHTANLVLLHRSEFPARECWNDELRSHPASLESATILKLQEIENLGGRVLLRRVDISDLEGMRAAFDATQAEFGSIYGVVHTAGVIDDGPIQEKTRERAAAVLAPKVKGTLVLDECIQQFRPEILVLCSSTSALLGLAGQADYVSANAFLDAYANFRRSVEGVNQTRVVSINWGVWSGVGMAVRSLQQADTTQPDQAVEIVSSATYNTESDWVLGEHRLLGGDHVLPGTGFLELAITSCWKQNGAVITELRDLFFEAPLTVKGHGECHVDIRLRGSRSEGSLVISSASSDSGLTEHARADWRCLTDIPPVTRDLGAIRDRCSRRQWSKESSEALTSQSSYLDFGDRWSNIKSVRFGDRELLAEICLDDRFLSDLKEHPVHPAMIDMATGSGIALTREALSQKGVYVPLTYGRLVAYRPLPRRIFSHVRLVLESEGDKGLAVFMVTITDETGSVLMDVENFTMRRVDPRTLQQEVGPRAPERHSISSKSGAVVLQTGTLSELIEAGITPAEGASVFSRVLTDCSSPQIVVSSIDLDLLVERTRPKRFTRSGTVAGETGDAIETSLLDLWTELLGVQSLHLDDDFFALGGQSLVAVRLFTKIKKMYKVDLGLATLFDARTVRQLASVLREHVERSEPAPSFSCLVPLRKEGVKPILFCVHGIGGNVLGYRELAKLLPEDQPFYAIQAQGLDSQGIALTNMHDIAAYYIREVLALQPEGPYYLSGYSFGGVAAYEMARQLTLQGHRVALLAMFDSDRPDAELDILTRLQLNVRHFFRLSGEERKKYVRRKFDAVADRFRRGHHPTELPAAVERPDKPASPFHGVRRANAKAYHSYQTQPYLGAITLFCASEFGDSGFRKPNLGWNGMAQGGLEVHTIPGNHMTILYEPNVSVLARKLTNCLQAHHTRESAAANSLRLNPPGKAYNATLSR